MAAQIRPAANRWLGPPMARSSSRLKPKYSPVDTAAEVSTTARWLYWWEPSKRCSQ